MTFPIHVQAPSGLATLTLQIREHATGDWLDFGDGTFKAAGHATPFVAMSEPDATTFPGLYHSPDVDPSLWSDGLYVAFVIDTDGLEAFDPVELEVRDGTLHRGPALAVCGLVSLASASGDVTILLWLLRNGELYGAPDSATVTVYDGDGATVFGPLVDAAPDANGTFKMVEPAAGLTADTPYYAVATVTADGIAYRSPVPFVVY